MQTSLIAVKSFVVLSGLQGNSSQFVNLRKRLNFLIHVYIVHFAVVYSSYSSSSSSYVTVVCQCEVFLLSL